ncbi:MAG TPA: Ig-like domain repeat protein, partial [Gemmataceae bacterium]|nr:Ig-like domain repeat protein [Gemmataceae bacterium]
MPNPIPDPNEGSDEASSHGVIGSDPNQKTGAAGFGPQAFVTPDGLLAYRIDFENEPTATAAAQQVDITDQLDGDLDWTTFELVSVGFGDVIVSAPPGSWSFHTTVPASNNGRNFVVEIDVRLDPATGRLAAHFISIDPLTGLPPEVLTGFLPPEDGTGRGQGHIGYIIRPRPGLVTGTEIRNVAEIRFDASEIVATNQVAPHDPGQGTDASKEALNTIDAGGPSSRVNSLPSVTNTADFAVSWTGSDDAGGSGIAAFDVFVSTDGHAFQPFLLGTTATTVVFHGGFGHSYAFYSVATDHVGHRQAPPAGAQATTQLVPPNRPPTADAGGPYAITEGGVLTPIAALASDPDGDALTYSWDVNGDGVFGDVSGVEPTLTWAQLAVLGITDGPRANAVRVRVSDGIASTESAATFLTVGNAPPAAGLAGPASGMRGQSLAFTLTATDPSAVDQAAGFVFRINWGDGTAVQTVAGPPGTIVAHTYAAASDYTVRLTAEDKDGGVSAPTNLLVSVVGQVTSIVAVTSSANPALVGQPVTFTATVAAAGAGTPAGTVQFRVDGVNFGGPQPLVGGVARLTTSIIAAGNHVVTAVYGGDGNYLPGSGQVTQAVRFGFGGFRPPLRPGDIYNLGRDLPIKFRLTDFGGDVITTLSAVRSLRIQRLDEAGNPLGLPFDPASTDGLGLRVTEGQFLFNWKTTGLTAGRYRIV